MGVPNSDKVALFCQRASQHSPDPGPGERRSEASCPLPVGSFGGLAAEHFCELPGGARTTHPRQERLTSSPVLGMCSVGINEERHWTNSSGNESPGNCHGGYGDLPNAASTVHFCWTVVGNCGTQFGNGNHCEGGSRGHPQLDSRDSRHCHSYGTRCGGAVQGPR